MAVLPPPFGVPYTDSTGHVSPQWAAYLLSISQAIGTDFAPKDAQYWVSTANGDLTNERNIGSLSTGYVKITTAIGIASPATVATIPTSDISGGAALTKVDDTNVTLTLGGTPATALLQATSLTLGWSGQLAVSRGGLALSTVSQGDLLYGSAANVYSKLAKDTGSTRYLSNTGGSNNPAWAQVALGTGVSGTLPVANGGTGADNTTQTYTPSLTGVTNVGASTAYQCQYSRVGSVVTVSGKVDIDPTAAGATELGVSLPIASNFGNDFECGGTAVDPAVAGDCAAISADAANNRAAVRYIAVDTANRSWFFSFTYSVI